MAVTEPFLETTRPHMAARIERFISRRIAAVLRRLGRQATLETYIGFGNTHHVRLFARALLRRQSDTFEPRRRRWRKLRGWRRFVTAEVPDLPVVASCAGYTFDLVTDADGYLNVHLQLPLEPGWHDVTLTLPNGRSSIAPILIIDPGTKVGIVSDIDDTIIVTQLPRPLLAGWNAFVRPEMARKPVPGMSEFYRRLRERYDGAPVIYVSTGAWNIAPAIEAFIDRNELPEGPALLTDWGPTNTGWFRSGITHKRDSLAGLRQMFPDTSWILIGDDGQHDPAIYAAFAAHHPQQTLAIGIRKLTPAESLLSHGLIAPPRPEEVPDITPYFEGADGFALDREFSAAGLL